MADTTSPLPELPATERDRFQAWLVENVPSCSRTTLKVAFAAWQAALAAARPAEQAQKAAGEVGKIVLFGGDLKEVSWAKGRMPPVGTKLYASPQAAHAARPIPEGAMLDRMMRLQEEADGYRTALEVIAVGDAGPDPVQAAQDHLVAVGHWRAEAVDQHRKESAAQQPAAPEGMVLVPREPTDTALIDFLEAQSHEGFAPNLVYDDDGNWAVSYSGMQPVPDGDGDGYSETVGILVTVEPGEWRKTIREAISLAMEDASPNAPAEQQGDGNG